MAAFAAEVLAPCVAGGGGCRHARRLSSPSCRSNDCPSWMAMHQRQSGSRSCTALTGRGGRLLSSTASSSSLKMARGSATDERRHDDHARPSGRRTGHQRMWAQTGMRKRTGVCQPPEAICVRRKRLEEKLSERKSMPWTYSRSSKQSVSHHLKHLEARSSSEPRMTSTSPAELDVEPPPIDNDIHDVQVKFGAVFDEESGGNVVLTFGNDAEALQAAKTGAVVVDRTHYGRIRVSGDDRIRFLHNQSTADFQIRKPGQGCDTVFVTPTARTIDLATAYIMNSSVIVVVSPSLRHELVITLDKYIFYADKVKVEDITDRTAMVSIVGPNSGEILQGMKAGAIVGTPYGTNMHFELFGEPVTIASGAGLASEGYTLIMSPESAGFLWENLVWRGVLPMGEAAWEKLRILEGRPSPGKELTGDYNPLEAGLWKTISLNKGCYIGQETIARVITYDAVKQQLWGLELEGPAEPGSTITAANGDEKVGKLTSFAEVEGKFLGLGYIKRTAGGEGLQVSVGETKGLVVEVPYLTRSLTE